MPNKNYARGRRNEYKIQELLEKAGYTTLRTAGSHGDWDIVAYNGTSVRFIQAKYGKTHTSIPAVDRERLESIRVPANVTKEWWSCKSGDTTPRIEVLK